jgi:hypothetical protein
MSRWYRAYEGTVTDAKLGEVALVAECSRSVAIAAWHAILESCACVNQGGAFDVTPRRVAVILGEPIKVIDAVFAELVALGLIADGVVVSWAKRQYESDNSTERARKHRERKRNADATLQQRSATAPETETETELVVVDAPASARPDLDWIEHECRKAAGLGQSPSAGLLNLSPIIGLLDGGADLETDVLPALRSRPNPKAGSWSYFVPQIADWRASRQAAANARGSPSSSPPAKPASKSFLRLAAEASHERNHDHDGITIDAAPASGGGWPDADAQRAGTVWPERHNPGGAGPGPRTAGLSRSQGGGAR